MLRFYATLYSDVIGFTDASGGNVIHTSAVIVGRSLADIAPETFVTG
ncbi:MAG: hypothetical protein U1C74_19025 [Phenylobacterium sp.]|nr:hypothetical protein [Phenylobacterium sp.]